MRTEEGFPRSYGACRERFLACAKALRFSGLNVLHTDYILPIKGPNYETLAIDFIKIWSHNDYTKAVIVSSGTHGPELLTGSAIQCQLMEDVKSGKVLLPRDTVLLLIHCVNPFGAAWGRRTNIRNIDLNRNFVPDFGQALKRERVHPQMVRTQNIYRQYPSLFAPKELGWLDFPRLALLHLILSHGLQAARFALSTGQRVFPMNLYYGGRSLEPETIAVVQNVEQLLFQVGHQVSRIVHIDVHTGAGEYKEQLIVGSEVEDVRVLERAFGKTIAGIDRGKVTVKGPVEGAIQEGLPRLLKEVKRVNWLGFGLEYGTEDMLRRFLLLRKENFAHFQCSDFEQFINLEDQDDHSKAQSYIKQSVKSELLELYAPSELSWQRSVLRQAREVLKKALEMLSEDPRARL